VAVEDTTSGIEAAHGAGMKCLAITNSYTADDLKAADARIESLEDLSWEKTTALFPNLQGGKW
jgi:beta-phosphoglucomutase-like phosphatase (HAD superfamily)